MLHLCLNKFEIYIPAIFFNWLVIDILEKSLKICTLKLKIEKRMSEMIKVWIIITIFIVMIIFFFCVKIFSHLYILVCIFKCRFKWYFVANVFLQFWHLWFLLFWWFTLKCRLKCPLWVPNLQISWLRKRNTTRITFVIFAN